MKKRGRQKEGKGSSAQKKKRYSRATSQILGTFDRIGKRDANGFFGLILHFFMGKNKRGNSLPVSQENTQRKMAKQDSRQGQTPTHRVGRYSTPLDDLLALVQERGTVPLSEAAKKFKISERLAEEWAKILENSKLLTIHYPAFGSPLLIRLENVNEKRNEGEAVRHG